MYPSLPQCNEPCSHSPDALPQSTHYLQRMSLRLEELGQPHNLLKYPFGSRRSLLVLDRMKALVQRHHFELYKSEDLAPCDKPNLLLRTRLIDDAIGCLSSYLYNRQFLDCNQVNERYQDLLSQIELCYRLR